MFNKESRYLLNLDVQNALDCISENFNLKNFPPGAYARNSLEKHTFRSPDGRYFAHIAIVYHISRPPLSQNPPSAPVRDFYVFVLETSVVTMFSWFSIGFVMGYFGVPTRI